MAKFTIVNSTLQISVGATNVLYLPTLYIGLQSNSLYQANPKVVLFNTAQGNNLTVFEGLLSDCTDSTDTPFTLESFLTFASTYFGTASNSSSPSTVSISGTVDTKDVGTSTPYKLISEASTNTFLIRDSFTRIPVISAIGLTSVVRYLKIYNTEVLPSVGFDTPVLTIPIPANTQGAGVVIPFSIPIVLPKGFGISITANASDSDATPVGAGDVIVNLSYTSY